MWLVVQGGRGIRRSTSNAPEQGPLALLTEAAEPAVRELAWAAQRYAAAAEADENDFESVYNHGLTLQELALKAGSSQEEQLELLKQVLNPHTCDLQPPQTCNVWNRCASNPRWGG